MRFGLRQIATQVNVSQSSTTTPSITINDVLPRSLLVAVGAIYDANTSWTLSGFSMDGVAQSFVEMPGTRASDRVRASIGVAVPTTGGNKTFTWAIASDSGGVNRYYALGCYEFTFIGYNGGVEVESTPFASEFDMGAADISLSNVAARGGETLLVAVTAGNSSSADLGYGSPSGMENKYRQNDATGVIGFDSAIMFADAAFSGATAQWSHQNNANDRGAALLIAFRPTLPVRAEQHRKLRNELAVHRTGWPSAVSNIKSWF